MKLKHNKRRNTAFIFEALVRELTKAAIHKDQKREMVVKKVITEFFNKKTVLSQELSLYKSLYETRGINKQDAEKIINEAKRVYLALNNNSIFDMQSRLVSQVNKKVSSEVFTNFIPNYKTIASISQIFNQSVPVKKRIMLEKQILVHMTQPLVEAAQAKKLNSVELKVFSKKFNEAYKGLLGEQKELLSKYVDSFKDNGLELKCFLNEELGRIKQEIKNSLNTKEIKEDPAMLKKMEEVVKLIDGFKHEFITEKLLKKILKMQELVNEIQTNE